MYCFSVGVPCFPLSEMCWGLVWWMDKYKGSWSPSMLLGIIQLVVLKWRLWYVRLVLLWIKGHIGQWWALVIDRWRWWRWQGIRAQTPKRHHITSSSKFDLFSNYAMDFLFSVLFGRWNCGGNEEDWCRDFVLDHPDRIWPVEDLEFARLDQGFLFLTPLIVRMKSQHIAASPLILENLADSIILMFFVPTMYWCKTCDRRIRFGA